MTTFTSLHFRAFRENVSVIDQLFNNTADATAYFNDHVVTAGDWTTGVRSDNVLDLQKRVSEPR